MAAAEGARPPLPVWGARRAGAGEAAGPIRAEGAVAAVPLPVAEGAAEVAVDLPLGAAGEEAEGVEAHLSCFLVHSLSDKTKLF